MSKYLIVNNYNKVLCKSDYRVINKNSGDFVLVYTDESFKSYLDMGFKQLPYDALINIEYVKRVKNFLTDLMDLYNQYDLSINYDDIEGKGYFIIEDNSEVNRERIQNAKLTITK